MERCLEQVAAEGKRCYSILPLWQCRSYHSFQTPFSAPWRVLGWWTSDWSLPLLLLDKVWVKRRESTRQLLGRKGLDGQGQEPAMLLPQWMKAAMPWVPGLGTEWCFIHQTLLLGAWLGKPCIRGSSKLSQLASASGQGHPSSASRCIQIPSQKANTNPPQPHGPLTLPPAKIKQQNPWKKKSK